MVEEQAWDRSLDAVTVPHNRPRGPPQVLQGDTDCEVPCDGSCLYHTMEAAPDVALWRQEHKETGYGRSIDIVRRDEANAHRTRAAICEIAERHGDGPTAARLMLSGPDGYPGIDDMEYFAELLQGEIIVTAAFSDSQMRYGHRYQLALWVRWCQATGGGDHFRLIQSWLPRNGQGPAGLAEGTGEAGPGLLSDGEGGAPHDESDEGFADAPDGELESRLSIHGARSSDADFDAIFAEADSAFDLIESLPAEEPRDVECIVELTDRIKKIIKRSHPTWGEWITQQALGALALYRVRLADVYIRDLVLLFHIVLGGTLFRAHESVPYYWNNVVGCFQKFEGLLPESIYQAAKVYLLCLEGLFRSFVGIVPRTDKGILEAVAASYIRAGSDHKKAIGVYSDNSIFNVGNPVAGAKGKGKGKPHGPNPGEEAAGMAVLHLAGDAPLAEAQPAPTPWYVFQAVSIAKVGHSLQSQLQGKDVIAHYCEWCSTPWPLVQGCAYIDCAFLYSASDSAPMRAVTTVAARRDIYVGIPHKLNAYPRGDPVLKAATERIRTFYRQTFWSNAAGWRCCQAALALAKRGKNVDHMFFMWGPGGVGLSLTTHHLAKMLGPCNHKYFDPQVFYLEEEMRKQVELLNGALVMTAQEKPEGLRKGFREDLFKKMATADGIFGRLPYQVLTRLIALCGWKRMELNKLITFVGVTERTFYTIFRRALLIKTDSRFLDEEFLASRPHLTKYGIFARLHGLKEELGSGPCVLAGLLMQQTFENTYGEQACRRLLDDYVLRGHDGGITERYMREACNLSPKKAAVARGDGSVPVGGLPPGFALSQEASEAGVDKNQPSLGSAACLRGVLLEQMFVQGLDSINQSSLSKLHIPKAVMAGTKKKMWTDLMRQPVWRPGRGLTASKDSLMPAIATDLPFTFQEPPETAYLPVVLQECYDVQALSAWAERWPHRASNVRVMIDAIDGCKPKLGRGKASAAQVYEEKHTVALSMLDKAAKLRAHEEAVQSLLTLLHETTPPAANPGASPPKRPRLRAKAAVLVARTVG